MPFLNNVWFVSVFPEYTHLHRMGNNNHCTDWLTDWLPDCLKLLFFHCTLSFSIFSQCLHMLTCINCYLFSLEEFFLLVSLFLGFCLVLLFHFSFNISFYSLCINSIVWLCVSWFYSNSLVAYPLHVLYFEFIIFGYLFSLTARCLVPKFFPNRFVRDELCGVLYGVGVICYCWYCCCCYAKARQQCIRAVLLVYHCLFVF